MDKAKVARELVKIAKELTAGNLQKELEKEIKDLRGLLQKANKTIDSATSKSSLNSLIVWQQIGELVDEALAKLNAIEARE